MKILVCTDGSRWAQDSVRFVVDLFRNSVHELTVLVFKQRPGDLTAAEKRIARGTSSKHEKSGQERPGSEIEGEVREIVGRLEVHSAVVGLEQAEGDLSEHILRVAADYDLVSLGGAGRGGFSHDLLGMIANRVILEGTGNLMVTKRVEGPCRRVLLAVRRERVDRELLDWVGTLISGADVELTLWVLTPRVLKRFEGYMEAVRGERLRKVGEAETSPGERALMERVADALAGHGVKAAVDVKTGVSFSGMIDEVEPRVYDLVMIHPPFDPPGPFQDIEPAKLALKLLRKIPSNVLLLRSLPLLPAPPADGSGGSGGSQAPERPDTG